MLLAVLTFPLRIIFSFLMHNWSLPGMRQGLTGPKHVPVQVYFSQFRKTPFGMLRLDPQDAGPGYRNVIGIPGGVNSPLFRVLQVCLL